MDIRELMKLTGLSEKQAKASITAFEGAIKKVFDLQENSLSTEVFDNLSDDEILETITLNLNKKVLSKAITNESSERKKVDYEYLNEYQKTIYFLYCFTVDLANGGLKQFYDNQGEEKADLIPSAMLLIGAEKSSKILEKANIIYRTDYLIAEAKQQQELKQGLRKKHQYYDPFDMIEDELATEDLEKLQINFIRKNKSEFLD